MKTETTAVTKVNCYRLQFQNHPPPKQSSCFNSCHAKWLLIVVMLWNHMAQMEWLVSVTDFEVNPHMTVFHNEAGFHLYSYVPTLSPVNSMDVLLIQKVHLHDVQLGMWCAMTAIKKRNIGAIFYEETNQINMSDWH